MKKGQVTLFIIAGILLLLFVSLGLYYRQVVLEEPEVIDSDIAPVKTFVEQCLFDVSRDAVLLAGEQAGYATIPSEVNLEKSYVSPTPLGLFKRPMWYFQGRSRIPSIDLIQQQLENYVKANIGECLIFDQFEPQFEIRERDDLSVEVTIAEKEIFVAATQLLRVKNIAKDEVTHLKNYKTVLPVRFKEAYDLGRRIVQEENRQLFLENITLDLMSLNSDIPFTGLAFKCGKERWHLSTIKEEIQDMLYYEIPKLRVENTEYPGFLADREVYEDLSDFGIEEIAAGRRPAAKPDDAYEFFHYLIDVKAQPTDLHVGFTYDQDHDFDIHARPSEGGVLKSESGQGPTRYLRFMCINFHHFTYDVSFPVQVMIRDDMAFNDEGFVLRFMLPVHIRSNRGTRTDFGLDVFEALSPFTTSEECDQLSGEVHDIRVRGFEDGFETELDGVKISYDCIQASCVLGETQLDGGVYRLQTQLPSWCGSGYLVAQKDDYLDSREQVTSVDTELDLRRLVELNYSVEKHVFTNNVIREGEAIPKNHRALVSVQSEEFPDLISYVQHPGGESGIKLIEDDTRYAVDILFVDELDNQILGGYKGTWDVSFEEILDAEEVVFHVLEYVPRPSNESDTFEMLRFLEEDELYKTELKPELI